MDQRGRADTMYDELQALLERADFPAYNRLSAELLELSQTIGYELGVARALNHLGNGASHRGHAEEAEHYYARALASMRAAGDRVGEGIVLQNMGTLALFVRMELAAARDLYEQGIGIFRECNQPRRVAITVANLAEVSRLEGDYEASFRYATESLDYFTRAGESERVGYHRVHVAYYRLLRRQYKEAIADLRQSYQVLADGKNPEYLSRYFETWFIIACELRKDDVAARLLGFLDHFRAEFNIMRLPFLMPWYAPQVERLQKHFSYDDLRELQTTGATLDLKAANDLTLSIAP